MCDGGRHDGDKCTDSGTEGELWDTEADLLQKLDVKSAVRQVGIAPRGAAAFTYRPGKKNVGLRLQFRAAWAQGGEGGW